MSRTVKGFQKFFELGMHPMVAHPNCPTTSPTKSQVKMDIQVMEERNPVGGGTGPAICAGRVSKL